MLAPGEPERQRRADRQKNGVPIDGTTWKQLIDVAHKVRLDDTEIPRVNSTETAAAGPAAIPFGTGTGMMI